MGSLFLAAAPATMPANPVVVSPFVLFLLAVPVLLVGEQLCRRISWLSRSNIPAPIVGGLIVAVFVLIIQQIFPGQLRVDGKTDDALWLWLTQASWEVVKPASAEGVERPLLILFFTCVGLNASWTVARQGGSVLVKYLGLAALLAVLQAAVGVATAKAVGQSPLLGVMCSSVSLMGGFGTSAGFAPEFEKAGLHGAAGIGIAAAAFGVIVGGLIAGPLAGHQIRQSMNRAGAASSVQASDPLLGEAPGNDPADALIDEGGFVDDLRNMQRHFGSIVIHLLALVVSLKLGAFLSAWVAEHGTTLVRMIPGIDPSYTLKFPIYMGAMIIAMVLRNAHDLFGLKLIDSQRTDLIASFALAWLLSAVMIGLNLAALAKLAMPMLIILVVQVVVSAAFCYWAVFYLLGRNYEAATMGAGMIGFGLGATPNAVATMRSLAQRYGPAPKAFLIVTVVGAFLIDFVNAILITGLLNFFRM